VTISLTDARTQAMIAECEDFNRRAETADFQSNAVPDDVYEAFVPGLAMLIRGAAMLIPIMNEKSYEMVIAKVVDQAVALGFRIGRLSAIE
jgi:hypothetical protein